MADKFTQDGRTLKVMTPLHKQDKNILLIEKFSGTEAVSDLFSFRLTMRSRTKKIPPDSLLTKGVTVSLAVKLEQKREGQRFFHGVVRQFGKIRQDRVGEVQEDQEFAYYAAELVPWLWLLTQTTDCRIFQDLTVPEIIKKVFEEWQREYPLLVNFEDKTDKSRYRKLDYCAQYRESDFAFVSRLMEQEGIFYYFKHEVVDAGTGEGKHTLVLGDDPGDHVPCPIQEDVEFKTDENEEPDEVPDAVARYVKRTAVQVIKETGTGAKESVKKILGPVIDAFEAIGGFISTFLAIFQRKKVEIDNTVDQGIEAVVKGALDIFGLTGEPIQMGVKSLRMEQEQRPGRYTLRDYHFEMPAKTLQSTEVTGIVPPGDNDKLEIYDYPGGYAKRFNKPGARLNELDGAEDDERRKFAKLGMESEDIPHGVCRGMARQAVFTAGHRFKLTKHPDSAVDGTYVLIWVEHTILQTPPYASVGEKKSKEGELAANGGVYHNNFACVPLSSLPLRPARKTPKAVVHGPQTAVVVGREKEEIEVDKFGRVKVQFHWDREGRKNENSSCFLRVGQLWAGKRWGASFWPRVGQEVIVAFLEGDPDQPIVIGSVYNAEQMPPYLGDGPDEKHKHDPKVSGIKTNTTPGGEGFNELRFDDTKDKQQVFIHAERNMDVRAKGESRERIAGSRHQIIGFEKDGKKAGDQRELVHKDKHLNVHGNQIEKIEGNYDLTIGHGDAPDGGTLNLNLAGDKLELIGKDSHLHIKGNHKEKVDGTVSLTVGGDRDEKVGGNHRVEATRRIHVKAGQQIVIEADLALSLNVGGNFVAITPAGIFIKGTMVMINSGGASLSDRGASPEAPKDAKEAKPARPDEADNAKTGSASLAV